jgi:hypothetical protein
VVLMIFGPKRDDSSKKEKNQIIVMP